MTVAYQVAPVDGAAEEELFLRVRRGALGPYSAAGEIYRWAYREGPDGTAEPLTLLADETPVGWIALQPRSLHLAGKKRSAGLLVNLAVVPEHRVVLPGLMLQRHAREHARSAFELSYGYPNRAALGTFRRAGYRVLGPVHRHACVLRHAGPFRRMGVPPLVAAGAGLAADALVGGYRLGRALRWSRRFVLEWPAKADARFDRLWARTVARSHGVLGRRDAAFLDWRFLRHPHEAHELVALTDRASGEIAAYAVVRLVDDRAGIGDLLAGYTRDLGPLLDAVLEACLRRGVSVVDCNYLGCGAVVDVLRSRGFRPRQVTRTAIVDGCDLPVERWHLTDLDGDL